MIYKKTVRPTRFSHEISTTIRIEFCWARKKFSMFSALFYPLSLFFLILGDIGVSVHQAKLCVDFFIYLIIKVTKKKIKQGKKLYETKIRNNDTNYNESWKNTEYSRSATEHNNFQQETYWNVVQQRSRRAFVVCASADIYTLHK